MSISLKKVFFVDSITLIIFLMLHMLIGTRKINLLIKLMPLYKYLLITAMALIIVHSIGSILVYKYPHTNIPFYGKLFIVFILITIIIIVPAIIFIVQRHRSAPYSFVHDGLLQTEEAIKFVLSGKNPYVEDYSDTPLALWPIRIGNITINPAINYFPYLPLTFLLPIPFQVIAVNWVHWFDLRFLFLPMYVGIIASSLLLVRSQVNRSLLIIILGLCPFYAVYVADGRNDVMVLFWLVFSITALKYKKINLSAVLLAFACSTKQFAWFFVPFYFLYISGYGHINERIYKVKKPLILFIVAFGLLVIPWIIMSPSSFYEDVFAYQSGLVPNGYPITGVGFSAILLKLGILESESAHFPFSLIQIGVLIPILYILLRKQLKTNTLKRAILNYGITLSVVVYFSRAFNDNYMGFLFVIFSLAVLLEFE